MSGQSSLRVIGTALPSRSDRVPFVCQALGEACGGFQGKHTMVPALEGPRQMEEKS